MERALQEFRVRGVKTNVPFLLNVVTHPDFLAGRCTTRFIDETPELFRFPVRQDRATKLLTYAAEVTVNGFPGVTRPAELRHAGRAAPRRRTTTSAPPADGLAAALPGARARGVLALGPRAEAAAADRHDLPRRPPVAPGDPGPDPRHAPRGRRLRPALPRDLLDRDVGRRHVRHRRCGSSRKTPGTAWRSSARRSPTSSSRCSCAARTRSATRAIPTTSSGRSSRRRPTAGIDLFRVFDSLNWVPNMEVALEAVREAGALCEAAICYTGDILDPGRPKYDLAYYVGMAKELEKRGANLIAIKDMAGPLQAVRRRAADQGAPRGGRRADPLPHPRHRRGPGGERPEGGRGRARHRRRRRRVDVGPDLAAEPQRDRRVAPVHPARDRASTPRP